MILWSVLLWVSKQLQRAHRKSFKIFFFYRNFFLLQQTQYRPQECAMRVIAQVPALGRETLKNKLQLFFAHLFYRISNVFIFFSLIFSSAFYCKCLYFHEFQESSPSSLQRLRSFLRNMLSKCSIDYQIAQRSIDDHL